MRVHIPPPPKLSTLTIPRLQALLKVVRARYMQMDHCSCCGESMETLYGLDHPSSQAVIPLRRQYEAVKAELKRRQS